MDFQLEEALVVFDSYVVDEDMNDLELSIIPPLPDEEDIEENIVDR